MASGSFTITGGNAGTSLYLKVDWSSTPNTEGNYSDVTVKLYLYHGTIHMSGATDDAKIWCNGTTKSTTTPGLNGSGPTLLSTQTFRVPHNNDGKKTCTLGASYLLQITYSGIWVDTISGSQTIKLDDIPRASSFTTPASSEAGGSFTVSITKAVSSFRHEIKVQLGSRTETYTGIDTSKSVTIPLEWIDQITSAASGVLTVTVTTKSGSTTIGTKSKTMTITVPASIVPTVSVKSITPVDQTWGLYIQGKSKVTIEIEAAGVYGSTISRYSIEGGGYTGAENPYTTGLLLVPGRNAFACTVYDSRGRSASAAATIEVTPYEPPRFLDLTAYRSTADGTADSGGTYVTAQASRAYSTCEEHNTCSMTVSYKSKDKGSYSTPESLEHGAAKTVGAGKVATTEEYLVKITVADFFTSVSQEILIGTDAFGLVIGKDRDFAGILMHPPAGAKGVWMPEDIHVGDKTLKRYMLDYLYPVGQVYVSMSPTSPTDLFGGEWESLGAGRTLIGVDPKDTDFNAAGKTGGEKTHKLTVAEMPSHTHNPRVAVTNGGNAANYRTLFATNSPVWSSSDAANATAPTGGDGAHNNLPPYITAYFWRRIA